MGLSGSAPQRAQRIRNASLDAVVAWLLALMAKVQDGVYGHRQAGLRTTRAGPHVAAMRRLDSTPTAKQNVGGPQQIIPSQTQLTKAPRANHGPAYHRGRTATSTTSLLMAPQRIAEVAVHRSRIVPQGFVLSVMANARIKTGLKARVMARVKVTVGANGKVTETAAVTAGAVVRGLRTTNIATRKSVVADRRPEPTARVIKTAIEREPQAVEHQHHAHREQQRIQGRVVRATGRVSLRASRPGQRRNESRQRANSAVSPRSRHASLILMYKMALRS